MRTRRTHATQGAPPGDPRCDLVQRLWPAWIAVAAVACYANSFHAPFVFDGESWVSQNPAIRHLWPPDWLTCSVRPIGYLSFALNFAVHGLQVWGYHAVNLGIHTAAALVLYAIVRRTLVRISQPGWVAGEAPGLAAAVALLWVVHPLQTQSLTYLYQRLEALAGLFYLLTLYAFLRAEESRFPRSWCLMSLACWLLGMGTKETAITAPLVVLWYDRALLASSWSELWRRRGWYYGVMASVVAAALGYIVSQRSWYAGGGVMVFGQVSAVEYAASQPGVILHYLRLCVWPSGQCLDYGWPIARSVGDIVIPGLVIAAWMAAVVWCVVRRPALGVLGGWFFLILSPTSSVVPIRDLAFEHRMYLPLAAVIAALVVGCRAAIEKLLDARSVASRRAIGLALLTLVAISLGTATHLRNRVYADPVTVWSDVVAKAPHNPRGHANLAYAYLEVRQYLAAEKQASLAVAIDPHNAVAHNNLGMARFKLADRQDALSHYQEALRLNPRLADAWLNMGNVLKATDRAAAIDCYRKALELRPSSSEARNNLGTLLARTQPRLAEEYFREALDNDPANANAHNNLANHLTRCGRFPEAIQHYRTALHIDPLHEAARRNLDAVLRMKNASAQ